MRLVTFTLAFFVFGAAFVTPIDVMVAHHNDAVGRYEQSTTVQEWSFRSFGSSLSNYVIRKRANNGQLLDALRKIIRDYPVRHETYGIVYDLEYYIDGWPLVVKIIYMERKGVTIDRVRAERKRLSIAELLYGSGRTDDSRYYYLIMRYKGLPFSGTGLSQTKATDLMNEAIASYKQKYCLQLLDPDLKKCVFTEDGQPGHWRAELVNWESGKAFPSRDCANPNRLKNMARTERPFIIPDGFNIFRPPPTSFQ